MAGMLFIRQMLLGDLDNFSYIIADKATGDAFVIDPAAPPALFIEESRKEGLELKGVLLTHGHYDHVVGLREYDVPVYLSCAEAALYMPQAKKFIRTADGEIIKLGGILVECLHSPGHAPGCQCFLAGGNLFTGDTLFVDAVGRTDLPGGSSEVMFRSLQKLKALPDDTVVWPGHHYGAVKHDTMGGLKKNNPFLACEDLRKFMRFLG